MSVYTSAHASPLFPGRLQVYGVAVGRSLELLQEVPAHGQGVVEEEAAELAEAIAVAVAVGA